MSTLNPDLNPAAEIGAPSALESNIIPDDRPGTPPAPDVPQNTPKDLDQLAEFKISLYPVQISSNDRYNQISKGVENLVLQLREYGYYAAYRRQLDAPYATIRIASEIGEWYMNHEEWALSGSNLMALARFVEQVHVSYHLQRYWAGFAYLGWDASITERAIAVNKPSGLANYDKTYTGIADLRRDYTVAMVQGLLERNLELFRRAGWQRLAPSDDRLAAEFRREDSAQAVSIGQEDRGAMERAINLARRDVQRNQVATDANPSAHTDSKRLESSAIV